MIPNSRPSSPRRLVQSVLPPYHIRADAHTRQLGVELLYRTHVQKLIQGIHKVRLGRVAGSPIEEG